MLFDISDLGPQGTWVEERVTISGLSRGPGEKIDFDPVAVTGSVRPVADGVEFTGRFETVGHFVCARCLVQFDRSVSGRFSLLLVAPVVGEEDEEAPEEAPAGSDDRDEDAEEVFRLDERGAVDLEQVLREQLDLALPLRALCSEECRGLCAGCGADLNHETCRCEPEVDERWAALEQLKRQLEGGSSGSTGRS
jgi:uncharacterized protein